MPCFAPGSGRCLPGKRSCLGPTKNPVSQAKHPRVETCCPAARSVSTRACICFHPCCSSTSQRAVQTSAGLEDAWPVLPHGVSSAKELLVELKTQLFFSSTSSIPDLDQTTLQAGTTNFFFRRDHSTETKSFSHLSYHQDGHQRRRSRIQQIRHANLSGRIRVCRPP